MVPVLMGNEQHGSTVLPTNVEKKSAARYRADIDGLRAVAVLMVLGTHLGVRRMSGGFIGVDIFFVISGYLITGIVARDIAVGNFSLSAFYERRVRRIVPALVPVLALSTVIVFIFYPPAQLAAYCYSLIAALFSYANLYFATQSGYFTESYTKVLQHTWSLGVEEQFYLILPVCLLFASKRSARALKWVVALGWLSSFTFSCVLVFKDANTAFYATGARGWELLTGSALALGMAPSIDKRWMREALAAGSLCALAGCMVLYSAATVFPGPSALVVCVATALLLSVGERGETLVTRPLRSKPIVFIGLISYSLYLWHWPLLVFVRLGLVPGFRGHTTVQQAITTVVCIAIASLSWQFAEKPFRTGLWKRMPRRQVFAVAAGTGAIFATLALIIIEERGFAQRFPPEAASISSYLDKPQEMNTGICFYDSTREKIRPAQCLTAVAGKWNVLLLGDSHAAMFWRALVQLGPSVNVMQLNASGCQPFQGNYRGSNCGRVRQYLFEAYLPTAAPDAVVLSVRWNTIDDLTNLMPTLNLLTTRHIPVYVIGPVPEYDAPLPLLLAWGLKRNNPSLAQSRRIRDLDFLDQQLADRLGGHPGVTYLSAYDNLCKGATCQEYVDSAHTEPLMTDDNHLSNDASLQLVKKWVAAGKLHFS